MEIESVSPFIIPQSIWSSGLFHNCRTSWLCDMNFIDNIMAVPLFNRDERSRSSRQCEYGFVSYYDSPRYNPISLKIHPTRSNSLSYFPIPNRHWVHRHRKQIIYIAISTQAGTMIASPSSSVLLLPPLLCAPPSALLKSSHWPFFDLSCTSIAPNKA